jgi:YgiT-type zinc finger domain-containing protein
MRCSIQGCPGHYEARDIVHTVCRGTDIFLFERVPADVCSVCGDTLLAPETVRHLEQILSRKSKADRTAPVYQYA